MTALQRRIDTARQDGTAFLVGGALIAAVAAYLFQFVGGRVLGSDEFAPVTVLWTLQFLAATIVLMPIEQLTVRRLALADDHPLRRDLPLISAIIAATAAVTVGAMYLARDQLLDGEIIHVVQAGLLVVGYGVFAVARGVQGGRRRFRAYGLATAAESTSRLLYAVVLLAITTSSVGLAWAMVAAPWIILATRPFAGRGTPAPVAEAASARGFLAAFILSSAASHTILAAGPLVVGALGGTADAISTFFITLILVRAPLTFSYGVLARVLEPMARMVRSGGDAKLTVFSRRVSGAGLALMLPAWLVGREVVPPVVSVLFGSDFRPTSTLGGLIAAGVVAAIASLVVGQILVARGQTSRLAAAWIAGLVTASIVIAATSGTEQVRVGLGFLFGHVVALAGIAVVTMRTDAAAVAPGTATLPDPVEEIF